MTSQSFPADVKQFVEQVVAAGEYASEDDVMIDAVRALRELKSRHQSLCADIRAAIGELDSGQGELWDIGELKKEFSRQMDAEKPSN